MTKSTVSPEVAMVVLIRDGYRCVRCGKHVGSGTRGLDYSIHHRRIKGMGGDRRWNTDLPGNLATLCGGALDGCHYYVHTHRADADLHGWTMERGTDDPTQAVILARGEVLEARWVYFDNHGGILEQPPRYAEIDAAALGWDGPR